MPSRNVPAQCDRDSQENRRATDRQTSKRKKTILVRSKPRKQTFGRAPETVGISLLPSPEENPGNETANSPTTGVDTVPDHRDSIEEKCRDVLVRYCAHVPRNYQYKDGMQVVFLILRDHLGDEALGIAGGVLYELIEVDCQYTDDPGAGFQRWRYDHMRRHADLELPHIPHLTTITSAIQPTLTLRRWRSNHPERYPIKLSDFSASCQPERAVGSSFIRHRKPWTIEHTMYVSSRVSGTSTFRSPNHRQGREPGWATQRTKASAASAAHLQVPSGGPVSEKLTDQRKTAITNGVVTNELSRGRLLKNLVEKSKGVHVFPWKPATEARQSDWLSSVFGLESRPTGSQIKQAALPPGRAVPHPSFARKFGLVPKDWPIPAAICQNLMPTAEASVPGILAEAIAEGDLDTTWQFRGPFTPQLGFDGGMEYDWVHSARDPETRSGKSARKPARSFITPRQEKRKQSRRHGGHDWFGLDAVEPCQDHASSRRRDIGGNNNADLERIDSPSQAPRPKPPATHNWFGLDGGTDNEGCRPLKSEQYSPNSNSMRGNTIALSAKGRYCNDESASQHMASRHRPHGNLCSIDDDVSHLKPLLSQGAKLQDMSLAQSDHVGVVPELRTVEDEMGGVGVVQAH